LHLGEKCYGELDSYVRDRRAKGWPIWHAHVVRAALSLFWGQSPDNQRELLVVAKGFDLPPAEQPDSEDPSPKAER
jgi:hypothetical protein